jgi:uncharacterized lipoprotein NlpE involved in copper resistance
MKWMNKVIGAIGISLLVAGCGESGEKENNETIPTGDTAQTQKPVEYLDVITAAYTGVTPCADCEGIDTRVTLYADTSYQLVMNYLGKDPKDTAGLNTAKKGRFMMHNDTLHLVESNAKYLKTDTALIQLDGDGKKIAGPVAQKFVLKKVK